MVEYTKRDRIGIGFFSASLFTLAVFFIMINLDHGHDIRIVIQGYIDFLVLIFAGILFLISVLVGWYVTYIRYIFLAIITTVLLLIITTHFRKEETRNNIVQRDIEEKITKQYSDI